jgi:UrcA family protein
MNTMNRLLNVRTAVPALLLSTLMGALGAIDMAAAAEPTPEIATRRINYSDLDLSRTAGAAALYRRIKSAARQVCDPMDSRAFGISYTAMHACVQQAIARAVADVNAPVLTSYHQAATGQPVRLAVAP